MCVYTHICVRICYMYSHIDTQMATIIYIYIDRVREIDG